MEPPEPWDPLFLMTNPCDLPIKWYAPASLYTAASSGRPLVRWSLLQARFLARISEADHAVVVVRLRAERGERGMSCGPPTTSWAGRDSDCWSMKWKQPHFINPAQRDAACTQGYKAQGNKRIAVLKCCIRCTIVVAIQLHYSLLSPGSLSIMLLYLALVNTFWII